MGERYRQLSLEERCTIAELHRAGQTNAQIAAALDRSPSTISRELKRNGVAQAGYRPAYAHDQAWARRWSGSRLERDAALREEVLDRLRDRWSPEQVAGRLARQAGRKRISYESIYRFIYAQIRRTNDGAWRHYLPRAKAKRGHRSRSGGSVVNLIPERRPIAERTPDATERQSPGHWEADYMLFARYGQNILVAHERTSRATLIVHTPDRKANTTADQLLRLFAAIPPPMRQTVTFDNGPEFAQHCQLHSLGLQTFFCDVRAPWQKGGVENAIGRLRRYLPRKTNLDQIPPETIASLASRYNHTPRKCLDFQTPAEALSNHLLHFECESTSRRPPG
jgi:transposase, IS30 family